MPPWSRRIFNHGPNEPRCVLAQGCGTKARMPPPHQPALARAIGRWSLAALVVNCILGSAVFGLPSVLAGLVGRASLIAVPVAGAATAVFVACYAEVASQFTQSGGTYLYVRVAFGRFAGIQVGWFTLLGRLTAGAANANLFVIYLGALWRPATFAIPRFLILTLLVGILAAVNYRGVRVGTEVSNVLVAAKLLPLGLVCVVGAFYLIAAHRVVPPPIAPASAGTWLKAMLVLLFAYGGFEAALNPMGEAKDPRRDAAFALFVAFIAVGVIYILIQWIVVGVLPDPAHSDRPLADAMEILMGRGGADLIAVGALISVCGYLSAQMLTGPRATFALAERGDFPLWFAAVHPKFRTPHVSILVFATLVWLLALFGSFAWNVTLAATTKLFYYGLICGAVPVLRRKQPAAASFQIPGGPAFAVLGVLICVILFAAVDFSKSLILATTFSIALVNWLLVRRAEPVFSVTR
jgi:basic amino acid/polyamine antiporter, APA family